MAPSLLSNSSLYLESSSADPVQIISTKQDVQQSYQQYQKPVRRIVKREGPHYKWDIVWKNVLIFILLHGFGIYGLYIMFVKAQWRTILFGYLYAATSAMGVTAGAHRLWAHRTYKAKLPLRIFLMICQSAALQNDLHEWVRDHRVHHKFTDTDADPHNSRRGFFFSHIGWLMVKKHKDVFSKGKTVDLSDIESDPVVMFQKRHYVLMVTFLCFMIPAHIPWYFWGEDWWVSWYVTIARYTLSLHFTWLVNSAAHIWGTKPYDKTINPVENKFVAWVAFGEGWHNYHHIFPWDYKAAELGDYRLNPSTAFLDLMAYFGLAYDLKTVSEDMVRKRVKRTGDGTWKNKNDNAGANMGNESDDHHHGEGVWGWGDKDMEEEDIKDVRVFNELKED
ncbi:acyl-CoA Delta-9 desaturase [Leptinotarsa decemlineata]|uniref:acyl-CoA Delta-9 desaturase n=1 Tax=Leptinotarsa decemlineata TaxID=7539 RepID=UPI003D3083AF